MSHQSQVSTLRISREDMCVHLWSVIMKMSTHTPATWEQAAAVDHRSASWLHLWIKFLEPLVYCYLATSPATWEQAAVVHHRSASWLRIWRRSPLYSLPLLLRNQRFHRNIDLQPVAERDKQLRRGHFSKWMQKRMCNSQHVVLIVVLVQHFLCLSFICKRTACSTISKKMLLL